MGRPGEQVCRATYADLQAAPPELVAEIINGELRTTRRPALPHTNVASMLGGELHGPFRRGLGGPGGWVILDEPELHLGEDILIPDLAGWRRERMPNLPDTAFATLAPDWVCEVLSPSTEADDRANKMPIYAREGVRHAWLIDPSLKTLEVCVLGPERLWMLMTVHRGERCVRAAPFEAIELDLALLWAK